MDFLTSQENIDLSITSDLGDNVLIVDEVTIEESIHDLFDIRVIVHSTNINIAFADLLGTNMTLTLNTQVGKRYFSGIVARFEQLHTTVVDKLNELTAFYQIRLVPKLWLLTHTKNYFIYQNKSVQEIIKQLLNDAQITDFSYKTQKGTTEKREYCVQYGESSYEFIARLCEEEGIFFHFEHTDSVHKLIFSDGSMVATPLGGKAFPYAVRSTQTLLLNHIYECFLSEQITTTDTKVVDFNYLKPSVDLLGESSGESLGGLYYDYPGNFQESSDGEPAAKRLLTALAWAGKAIHGTSSIAGLLPYNSFKIENHPRASINAQYIVYRVKHKISQTRLNDAESSLNQYGRTYENQFWAFPSTVSYAPLLKHPKKRIHSLQTATVTGPSGEEIYTDEYGRIKVKFHWDVEGEENEKSSCWIRVTQSWAGSQWGAFVIPRIGMEVVVSFIDGDPDRPLVIGCVYNGESLPPYDSNDPTKSTFKTSSTKGNEGNNELRFDDKKDSEEIYIHAQKDMNIEIEDSRTEDIIAGDDTLTIKKGNKSITQEGEGTTYTTDITDGDKSLDIKKGNHSITLTKGNQEIELTKGDQSITLTDGSQSITITKGDQTIELGKGDQSTTLKQGDMTITLSKGDIKISATGKIKISATSDIDFDSKGKITMKGVGGIKLETPADIKLDAKKNVEIKAAMNCMIDATTTLKLESKATAMIKSSASMAINCDGPLVLKGALFNMTAQGIGTIMASGPLALKGAVLKLN